MTRIRLPLLAATAALALGAPAAAHAADHVPGEVVVQYKAPGASAASVSGRAPRVVRDVRNVTRTIHALRKRPDVAYAVPNVKAHAAAFIPNDPGRGTTVSAWQAYQWNFSGPFSVNAPDAWEHTIAAGRPGGRGVVVAVLDTGVAYRARGKSTRSPDFNPRGFVRGYDFVDHDPYPIDRNGHGTHVASTIGEQTNNGVALTGLAYGARIMPVRVLDDAGEGDASDIADGVRFAAKNGAKIINLSLEFTADVRAGDIPQLLDAIDYAHRKGALLVAASGNEGRRSVAYPARADHVMSVGATTEHGCVSDFSNQGPDLDIVAPGGGSDASFDDDPDCQPEAPPGRDIYQMTLVGPDHLRFAITASSYEGTSMAAPHVSATAALVIASGAIGPDPTPGALEKQLESSARDLGPPGPDQRYGAGLIDAAKATTPAP